MQNIDHNSPKVGYVKLLDWLRQKVNEGAQWEYIDYRTLVSLRLAVGVPTPQIEEASEYFIRGGPHASLGHPHLFGMITQAYAHAQLARQSQTVRLEHASPRLILQTLYHIGSLSESAQQMSPQLMRALQCFTELTLAFLPHDEADGSIALNMIASISLVYQAECVIGVEIRATSSHQDVDFYMSNRCPIFECASYSLGLWSHVDSPSPGAAGPRERKDGYRNTIATSLSYLGFGKSFMQGMFGLLAAIRHLEDMDSQDMVVMGGEYRSCPDLLAAALLLGIPEAALDGYCMESASTTSLPIDHRLPRKSLSELKTYLYISLFGFIARKVSQHLRPTDEAEYWITVFGEDSSRTPYRLLPAARLFNEQNCENEFLLDMLKCTRHDSPNGPTGSQVHGNMISCSESEGPWRILCLNTTPPSRSSAFDRESVRRQLQAACPLGILPRLDHGFCQLSHPEFTTIFQRLLAPGTIQDLRKASRTILQAACVTPSDYVIEGTHVGLTRSGIASLWKELWASVDPDDVGSERAFELEKQAIEAEAMRLAELDRCDAKASKVGSCRRIWLLFAHLSTVLAPNFILSRFGVRQPDAQMAWREKVALCTLITLMSSLMLFFVAGMSNFICPHQRIMTAQEVALKPADQPHVIVHGIIYDATPLLKHHNRNGALGKHITDWAGRDASHLFTKPASVHASSDLLVPRRVFAKRATEGTDSSYTSSTESSSDDDIEAKGPGRRVAVLRPATKRVNWATGNGPKPPIKKAPLRRRIPIGPTPASATQYVHSPQCLSVLLSLPDRYFVGVPHSILEEGFASENAKVSVSGAVYDISGVIGKWAGLSPEAVEALSAPWGVDKSAKFKYPKAHKDIEVLREKFVGMLDERNSMRCLVGDWLLVGSAAIIALVMVVRFLAAMQFGPKRDPEELDKFVVMLVPCFTEDEDSLRKTIDSLALLRYDDRRKLLFIIVDGMAVGKTNSRPTAHIVLDILGIDPNDDPPAKACEALGSGQRSLNYAKVHSGLYECGGHRVPFVVVIKAGLVDEEGIVGNRGKRDSQMLLLRFFSRIYYNEPLSPLELNIYEHLKFAVGVDPSVYEYLLMVDADTEVMPDALNRLVSWCVHDSKIIGICGETRLANEKRSIFTMIQVYEYYISHHLAKAFESLFGTVTCLPGCFCMYRLRTASRSPILVKRDVLEEYSDDNLDTLHRKNLLSLGEDRYLTTLMLKHFPKCRTKFTPDAVCKTTVPETWNILLSQRRRWINSTIHNLFELICLPNLCGFGCFSMRFIVLMDLYATLLMPASVLYLIYLIFRAVQLESAPIISLGLIAMVYGMQILLFLMKRKWEHIGWMLLHFLAIPMFGVFIPVYAFWHFDDFSWGQTRSVVGAKMEERNYSRAKKLYTTVERRTWEEHIRNSDPQMLFARDYFGAPFQGRSRA